MKMIRKLFILAVTMFVLLIIPYMFGWGWLFMSWMPALFVMMYLED